MYLLNIDDLLKLNVVLFGNIYQTLNMDWLVEKKSISTYDLTFWIIKLRTYLY